MRGRSGSHIESPLAPTSAWAATAGLLLAVVLGMGPSYAGDAFRQLKGARIRAAFSGMEFTDEVHWVDLYRRDGTLSSASMGLKRTGRWRLDGDSLCLEWKDEETRCYEVWISGKSVQLRQPGHPVIDEGILRPPAGRH